MMKQKRAHYDETKKRAHYDETKNKAHYNETKKRAYDSQIVRAKENLKLSHGEPSQRQISGTNQRI